MSAVSARYLTPREVAEALKCGRTLVYDLVGDGQLRHVRLGSGPKARIRIPADALDDFAHEGESPARAPRTGSRPAVEPRPHGGDKSS